MQLLPPLGRSAKRSDDRKVLDGISYILRTGASWRDLPRRCGPHATIYNRYVHSGRKGAWKAMFLDCRSIRQMAAFGTMVERIL